MSNNLPPVCNWLSLTTDQVLDRFLTIPSAYTDGIGTEAFVYIPGTRDDRALIVAHADTCFDNTTVKLGFEQGIVFSKARSERYTPIGKTNNGFDTDWGVGIGADDRAGCAILWELRNLGHSLLITSGEELGCIASRRLAKNDWWSKELNKHTFAVQFDRRGYKDIVFYDVGTNAFVNYVKENTGFTPERGFGTDIRVLCKSMCGVNMSVGYYDEHKPNERLVLTQWENTLFVAKEWLKQTCPYFPLVVSDKFELPVQQTTNSYQPYSSNSSNSTTSWPTQTNNFRSKDSSNSTEKKIKKVPNISNPTIFCKNESCGYGTDEDHWFENQLKCPKCGCCIW